MEHVWRLDGGAALLRGPSGAGKSDLALRLIGRGARLVADDQVRLTPATGRLIADAPAALRGLLEVRGVGLVRFSASGPRELRLVVDLVPPERIERLPAPARIALAGVEAAAGRTRSFRKLCPRQIDADAGIVSGPVTPANWRLRAMTETAAPRRRVLLVTGISGAGLTTAVKALEDLGYEAVDNLPLTLIPPLLRAAPAEGPDRPLVLGVDIRTRDFDEDRFIGISEGLAADAGLDVGVIFLDCDNDVLVRRFAETRRRHPLAEDRPVTDGIAREREMLAPLRRRADLLIDTSNLPARDLKQLLAGHYALAAQSAMTLSVLSFSYREGLPRQADLVFDVRFLRNPHYVDDLRPLTGRQSRVDDYVAGDPAFGPFMAGTK